MSNISPTPFVEENLHHLFQRQRDLVTGRAAPTDKERALLLSSLIRLLKENYETLVEAEEADFRVRSRGITLMYEVLGSIQSLKFSQKNFQRWMRPSRRKVSFPANLLGAKLRVEYQPKGVVGILGTWNMPIFTLLSPLAQVIAAGNRAMLKPSDLTPNTARVLAEIMPSYVDSDWVAVVEGDVAIAKQFSTLPFDHLVLTGGVDVGKAVMGAASTNLTPVTLELGGKSPVIVGRTASIDDAAEKVMFAKAVNAGQLCVNADYVYLPKKKLDAFVLACKKYYRSTYLESPEEAGSVINQRHRERMESYLEDARSRGLTVIPLAEERNYSANCMPLYIVKHPGRDSLLGRNEIFGPILNVYGYDSIQEAIDWVNSGARPLALYYFGKDKSEERLVLDTTVSGGVTINNIAQHPGAEDAPFGGIGDSGMGHYHGLEGFREFSHARTIYTQGWMDFNKLIGARPPFGEKLQKQLESVLKKP